MRRFLIIATVVALGLLAVAASLLLVKLAGATGPINDPSDFEKPCSDSLMVFSPDSGDVGVELNPLIMVTLKGAVFKHAQTFIELGSDGVAGDDYVGYLNQDDYLFFWDDGADTLWFKRRAALAYFMNYLLVVHAYWDDGDCNAVVDTARFRTTGKSLLMIGRRLILSQGFTLTGAGTMNGIRSPGMTVYRLPGDVVVETPTVDYAQEWRDTPFSYTVSGLRSSIADTVSFYGLNEAGQSSDTITVKFLYRTIGQGTFYPK